MTYIGETIAQAARALVGARFRAQGRDPVHGLDCVGLAAAALRAAGAEVRAPRDYPQRGGDPKAISAMIGCTGLEAVDPDQAVAGDVLLLQAGPGQYHLAIRTGEGFVHADAGLRRVVEAPGVPRWPILGVWRARGGEG